ncbi:response regulator [Pseudodesulfovibrio sp. JC047]|uniref:ATP-binding protein n=1 Tax=Pseudodesulfovibrio sp. JC047 TaxID=2683199 RepID=UPI0013D17C52|nr:ATP-binding protein [Pseudodesulfovibrio sp. JC047]NDV18554.1 response regulator [Pseudodesulfovibrio sp. JC047]
MAQITGMSLFKKMGLLAFCLFGCISVLTSALTAYTLYDRLIREYTSKGAAIATAIASSSQEILLDRDAATTQSMIDQYLSIEGVAYVFVADSEGTIVSHTFVPEVPVGLRSLPSSKQLQILPELKIGSFGRVIDICVPVLAGVAGYVHVGMDKDLVVGYFWKAILDMQLLLFVTFWACVGILYYATRRISRPLRQLTEYARKLAAHDFTATIDIQTRDELNLLGRAMQSMGQELSLLFTEMNSEVDKATRELRDHMAYLSAILDNLADGLLVVGVTGEITVVNPAMRALFDLEDMDYSGQKIDEVFPDEVLSMLSGVRTCSLEIVSAELPLSRGRIGKAISSSVVVSEPVTQCLGGVVLVRDITREKELDQLKTDFISTVSHELRTPMTSVLGFSKIIRKKLEQAIFPLLADESSVSKPIKQVRGNMEIIVSEAERLTELINDVLDIARMEAGEIAWRDSDVSMGDVLVQSRNSTKGLWKAKGLAVELYVEAGLPPVYGDYGRLVQVVVNLLANAIKFSDESPIICGIKSDGEYQELFVKDRGPGIELDDLETVFAKFKQVGDTLTGKPEGTGLGLPICRRIVERHGGRIWAESTPGEGSSFHCLLPSNMSGAAVLAETTHCLASDRVGQRSEPASPEGGGGGKNSFSSSEQSPKILVVDDDAVLVRFLGEIFESNGFQVCFATNGEDAVRLARELTPDLVTMDIMMPLMDGREAIKSLRSDPVTQGIPILVITALSGEEDNGGDMALTKPVDETRLLEAARNLLGRRRVCKPCIVLGQRADCHGEDLSLMCADDISFVSEVDFWAKWGRDFRGTVFIPARKSGTINLERLTKLSGVSIVILPSYTRE